MGCQHERKFWFLHASYVAMFREGCATCCRDERFWANATWIARRAHRFAWSCFILINFARAGWCTTIIHYSLRWSRLIVMWCTLCSPPQQKLQQPACLPLTDSVTYTATHALIPLLDGTEKGIGSLDLGRREIHRASIIWGTRRMMDLNLSSTTNTIMILTYLVLPLQNSTCSTMGPSATISSLALQASDRVRLKSWPKRPLQLKDLVPAPLIIHSLQQAIKIHKVCSGTACCGHAMRKEDSWRPIPKPGYPLKIEGLRSQV